MNENLTYTAFAGETLIASGPLEEMLPKLKAWSDKAGAPLILIFEDQTGQQVDFNLRGTLEQVLARALPSASRTGPGRPKLGVVSREVSLLPRHWAWLEEQPNGASAALRRLIEEAKNRERGRHRVRFAIDAVSRFMSSMAGNLPGYEEATRALYARDRDRLETLTQDWPRDIRLHIRQLIHEVLE